MDFDIFLNQFQNFLEKNNLIEEDKLSGLKSYKLCISGSFFINKILEGIDIFPMNGLSEAILFEQIKKFHQKFEENKINIMIVFDGFSLNPEEPKEKVTNFIKNMWKLVVKNKGEDLKKHCKTGITEFFLNDSNLFTLLNKLQIEYVLAPYSHYAQMRWLYSYDYVNILCAKLDFLAFCNGFTNFNNLIIDINLDKNTFQWIDFKLTLRTLQVNINNLHDLFIFAGFINNYSLLNLKSEDKSINGSNGSNNNSENLFQKVLNPVQKKEGFNLSNLFDQDTIKIYHHNRKKMEKMPIFNSTCEVERLSNKDSSSEQIMFELYGAYLPQEVYIFLCFNLISKKLAGVLAHSKLSTNFPLADSVELRSFIDINYCNGYNKIIAILVSSLNSQYRKQQYTIYKYYNRENPSVFSVNQIKLPQTMISENYIMKVLKQEKVKATFVNSMNIFISFVKEDKKNSSKYSLSESSTPSINSPSKMLERDSSQKSCESLKDLTIMSKLSNTNEILTNCLLIFLDLFDYLKLDNKTPTILGCALRKCNNLFEEEILILMELMKTGINHIFSKQFCDAVKIRKISIESPSLPKELIPKDHEFNFSHFINLLDINLNENEKSQIIFISRVFSLISPSKSIENCIEGFFYYDYDLSQYLCVLQNIQDIMFHTYESILLNMFLSYPSNEKRPLKLFMSLKDYKPFQKIINVNAGIFMKLILQNKVNIQNMAIEDLNNIKADIKKGLNLWENLREVFNYLKKKGEHNKTLMALFDNSDQFLKKKMKDLGFL